MTTAQLDLGGGITTPQNMARIGNISLSRK